jgi:hypothetical protein
MIAYGDRPAGYKFAKVVALLGTNLSKSNKIYVYISID